LGRPEGDTNESSQHLAVTEETDLYPKLEDEEGAQPARYTEEKVETKEQEVSRSAFISPPASP